MIQIPDYQSFSLEDKVYFCEVNTDYVGFLLPHKTQPSWQENDARNIVESIVPSEDNLWWNRLVELKQVTLENGLPKLSRITNAVKAITEELIEAYPLNQIREFVNNEEHHNCKFPHIFDVEGTLYYFNKRDAELVRDGDTSKINCAGSHSVRSYKFKLDVVYYSRYWETVKKYIELKEKLTPYRLKLIKSLSGGQK